LEAEFCEQCTPLTVLSARVGFGLGDEPPDALLTLGSQRSF
jgi:hypothetical protein